MDQPNSSERTAPPVIPPNLEELTVWQILKLLRAGQAWKVLGVICGLFLGATALGLYLEGLRADLERGRLMVNNLRLTEENVRLSQENAAIRSRTPPAADDPVAQTIFRFYQAIDSDKERCDDAWSLIHRARKQEVTNTIPDSLAFCRFYSTTIGHQDVRVDRIVNSQIEPVYRTSFDVEDRFLLSSLYGYRGRLVREAFETGLLNRDGILRILTDNLKIYFKLSADELGRVEEFLNTRTVSMLFSPQLISEIQVGLHLRPRTDYELGPKSTIKRHFVLDLTLMREDDQWKIRKGLYPYRLASIWDEDEPKR